MKRNELIKFKKEFIEFLVEECYSNFPELIEKFSKNGMYKKLNTNIKSLLFSEKNDPSKSGLYSVKYKMIKLYNVKQFNLDFLKNNEGIKQVASHEGIHALFKKGNNSGCQKIISKIDLKNSVRIGMMNFKSSKTVFEKIKALANILRDCIISYEKGRGLNEGFTEWVNFKCFKKTDVYISEVAILLQLEQFRSKKDILKIGDGDYEQMAELFNMEPRQFNIFVAQIDEMLFDEKSISKNRELEILKKLKDDGKVIDLSSFSKTEISNMTKQGLIKDGEINLEKVDELYERKIAPYRDSHNFVATEIQRKLLQRVILPNINESSENKVHNIEKMDRANTWIRLFMNVCNIKEERLPEYKEFHELYLKALKKRDKIFFEKVQEMKNTSDKINLCKLNEMFFAHKYTESLTNLWKTSFEIVLGREIKEDEVPEILKEFKDVVYLKKEKNEECKFWNSDEFVIEPLERKSSQEKLEESSATRLKRDGQEVMPIPASKGSFFKRLVNKLVKSKKITLEEVSECELTNENQLENNKGDK